MPEFMFRRMGEFQQCICGMGRLKQSGSVWDYNVYLDLPPGEWVRIEQNIAADIMRLTPTVLYQSTGAIRLWGRDIRVDDIRFSNSMTTERNSLLPGSIGQVAYRERWEGTGGSPTPTYGGSAHGGGQRRWNSYNHIGNVVGISNASGYFVEAVNTDAFGNPLASTETGEWAGGLGGNRGLTTKELGPAAGMYYFYQRWYDPQTATFASRAPYPPMVEHAYGFALSAPLKAADSKGMSPALVDILDGGGSACPSPLGPDVRFALWSRALRAFVLLNAEGMGLERTATDPETETYTDERKSFRHCLWMCLIAQACKDKWYIRDAYIYARNLGTAYEFARPDVNTPIDIHNNAIGAGIGMLCDDPLDCYRGCRNAARSGALRSVFYDNDLVPPPHRY